MRTAVLVLVLTLCTTQPSDQDHHHSEPAQKVGRVSFPLTQKGLTFVVGKCPITRLIKNVYRKFSTNTMSLSDASHCV